MALKPARMNGKVRVVSPEETRKEFEQLARRHFKMTGKQFLRKWEAGEFGDPDDPYRPELWDLVWLLPYVK